MKEIKFTFIEDFLKQQFFSGIFLFMGDDVGQMVYAEHKILTAYFKEKRVNKEVYDYAEIKKDPSLLRQSLSSLQLFDNTKAVIIKDLDGTAISEKLLKVFLESCGSDVIVVIHSKNLRKSSSAYKKLVTIDNLCVINCYALESSDTQHFISNFFRNRDVNLKSDLVLELANLMPENVQVIHNELEKLLLYCTGNDISMTDIERLFIDEKKSYILLFFHAVISKNKDIFLQEMSRLSNDDTSEIMIIRILQSYASKVMEIKKIAYEKKTSLHQAMNFLSPPIFFKEKSWISDICNKLSYSDAVDLLYDLVKLEIACKFNDVDVKMELYLFFINLFLTRNTN